jgi:hypothetical protein
VFLHSQGQSRQIGDVRDESGSPPIAPALANRSNNGLGQGTKSLRDSPLRGGKSREAVASREESDGESTRSPRSTSLLLQRSALDQAHQVDLRPVSDAAMARCWNDKMALTNSANRVA